MMKLHSASIAESSAVHATGASTIPVTKIRSGSAVNRIDWRELFAYRDLFTYLVRREVKVRYAQSAIGVGWAILQPLFTMLVFCVIFGRLAKVSSDGAPYALFSFAALMPWMFFSNAVTDGVSGMISGSTMMSKVYFPRMLMPLAANAARLIDFCVAAVVMVALMAWYQVMPNIGMVALPWIVAIMLLTASGMTLWLATFAMQFRDVKHALGFIVQILMYAAPVVYSARLVPDAYQHIYAINPMVGVIEGLRSASLGTRPMPWDLLLIGSISSVAIFLTGMNYFNAKQRLFADLA